MTKCEFVWKDFTFKFLYGHNFNNVDMMSIKVICTKMMFFPILMLKGVVCAREGGLCSWLDMKWTLEIYTHCILTPNGVCVGPSLLLRFSCNETEGIARFSTK